MKMSIVFTLHPVSVIRYSDLVIACLAGRRV